MNDSSTVVFADLTGSSAAYEVLGSVMAAGAVNTITQWIGRMFEAHGGRVVKYLGDGVMAVFPKALQAVSACVSLQQRYQKTRESWLNELQGMRLKIGIASGPVVVVGDDVLGEPVNLASRLCDMAGSDAIWAHEDVMEQARNDDQPSVQALLQQDDIQVLPADQIKSRWLGSLQVPGLKALQPVIQVFWSAESFALSQLTMPGELDDQPQQPGDDAHASRQTSVPTLVLMRRDVRIELRGEPGRVLHIGRGVDQDFVVGDQRVSRKHARVEWSNGGFELTDLSSYGSWVRYGEDAGAEVVALRRTACRLHGRGALALGTFFTEPNPPLLDFEVIKP